MKASERQTLIHRLVGDVSETSCDVSSIGLTESQMYVLKRILPNYLRDSASHSRVMPKILNYTLINPTIRTARTDRFCDRKGDLIFIGKP